MTLDCFGVLWDLDGVLVDTGHLHFETWQQIMDEEGIPFSYGFFRRTFGMNNVGVLEQLLGQSPTPEMVEQIAGRKEALFRQLIPRRVQVLPGARDWLERFRAWAVPQAVATSAPPANMDAMVDALGLRPYFDALVSGFDLPSKPDPAVFLAAAERIGVPPEHCLVFEDAVAGVEAARRAGMRCIAVTTTNPAAALQAADLVVERLDALSTHVLLALLDSR